MKKIVIIGGGIAGLAAAHRIQQAIAEGAPLQCVLLETSARFGGKIATERFDGFVVERGPDSFISQKPAAIEFCKCLGLADRLVGTNPDRTATYVYTGGKLVTMPDGLSLMIPTKFLPFVLTPLFSLPGKMRMGMDLIIPKKRGKADESLAAFVRRRMGEEALRKMAEPMLAGIYASDPETMSIQSTFPMFVQTEQKYRSLILGMLDRKRQMLARPQPRDKKLHSLFMTLKSGLAEMVDAAMQHSPDVAFRSGETVTAFAPTESGWHIGCESGFSLDADSVVFATPASITARFLKPVAPEAAEQLEKIRYVSTATVTLAYRREGFSHALDGFGFVVPKTENKSILACTWTSSKFPHRAPEDHVMLRCYLGGALQEDIAELEEDAIAGLVQKDLKNIMGIGEQPVFVKVFHNKKANVQYQVGHAALIESVQNALSAAPGVFLTGSAYTGIGIPDCIQNGTCTAESLLQYLTRKSETVHTPGTPG